VGIKDLPLPEDTRNLFTDFICMVNMSKLYSINIKEADLTPCFMCKGPVKLSDELADGRKDGRAGGVGMQEMS
jgi:hypothetical protein